ncbi:hypothetical protein VaNZ11_002491 [Volvox africanus]|uniref:Flagellar associated protein n=1 Tax=Volvox africanus TaxID=51714 RepID=A0ABQ5RTD6_9CHLO|nr:hypothetical protein VaNZ11_002491 [Volvox africanus]
MVNRKTRMATRPAPEPPRQGEIWWSVAPPAKPDTNDPIIIGISDEQLRDWLRCTTGWKALELTWGALQSCEVQQPQLKPLLQAAMAEAARLGVPTLVIRQLDVDEVVGRCVALALSGFPNFKTIKLRELNLYDEAMGHLSGALHSADHVRNLVLDSVWASVGGWSALAAAIKVNNSLTTLRMRYCPGPAALSALCSLAADQQGRLEALQLARNSLGSSGVEELCQALVRSYAQSASRPSRVAHLDLSYNSAGRQCVPAVAAMLRTVRSLRHLDLSCNELGPEAVRDLCSALSYAPHVTILNLAATGADDSAVEALTRGPLAPITALAVAASGLGGASVGSGSSALATLCLAHNRISCRGAALLAAAARRAGCPLLDVDLGYNALLGEEGAKAWAEALSGSSSASISLPSLSLSAPAPGTCRLRRLVLSGCEVPDAGAFCLGAALKGNTSLQELGLAENHISTHGLALLAEVLKVNSTLRLLDVSLNMVGPRGMTPLTRTAHLRGHMLLNKDDHTVQRVNSCVVKTEILREYRNVEAVKHSREPWEEEERQRRQQQAAAAAATGYINPFLDPVFSAAAAAGGGSGGSNGAGGGGLQHGGSYNPFLSPSATYINPFLDLSPAAVAVGTAGGGDHNPFLMPTEAVAAVNPFVALPLPLEARGAEPFQRTAFNPFLSPAASRQEEPYQAEGNVAAGVESRELATRVVTKLGTHGSVSMNPGASSDGGGDGGSEGDRGGDDSSSGSGTGVYVSSRSTADEADLVTDTDLRLVDFMLEKLGMDNDDVNMDTAGANADDDSNAAPSPRNAAPSDESLPHSNVVRQAVPFIALQGGSWPLADSRLDPAPAGSAASCSGTWGAVVGQRADELAVEGPDEVPFGQQYAYGKEYDHSEGHGCGDGGGDGGTGGGVDSWKREAAWEGRRLGRRQQESGPTCWGQGGGGCGTAWSSDGAREDGPDPRSKIEAPAPNPFL